LPSKNNSKIHNNNLYINNHIQFYFYVDSIEKQHVGKQVYRQVEPAASLENLFEKFYFQEEMPLPRPLITENVDNLRNNLY
jgi:hypothetical protein